MRRIFAIFGVSILANQMSRPYLPLLVEDVNAGQANLASAIGLVTGTAALVGALLSPLAGPLGDRVGFRRVLAGSLLGAGTTLLLMPLAPGVAALAGVAVVYAALQASTQAMVFGLVAVEVAPERRSATLNLVLLPLYVAGIIGPTIGAVAAGVGGIAAPFVAAGDRLPGRRGRRGRPRSGGPAGRRERARGDGRPAAQASRLHCGHSTARRKPWASYMPEGVLVGGRDGERDRRHAAVLEVPDAPAQEGTPQAPAAPGRQDADQLHLAVGRLVVRVEAGPAEGDRAPRIVGRRDQQDVARVEVGRVVGRPDHGLGPRDGRRVVGEGRVEQVDEAPGSRRGAGSQARATTSAGKSGAGQASSAGRSIQ